MNLYLISQNYNEDWDTYDSAVVVAETEEEAKLIHPRSEYNLSFDGESWVDSSGCTYTDWSPPKYVKAIYIGKASEDFKKNSVVCGAFNAG